MVYGSETSGNGRFTLYGNLFQIRYKAGVRVAVTGRRRQMRGGRRRVRGMGLNDVRGCPG